VVRAGGEKMIVVGGVGVEMEWEGLNALAMGGGLRGVRGSV